MSKYVFNKIRTFYLSAHSILLVFWPAACDVASGMQLMRRASVSWEYRLPFARVSAVLRYLLSLSQLYEEDGSFLESYRCDLFPFACIACLIIHGIHTFYFHLVNSRNDVCPIFKMCLIHFNFSKHQSFLDCFCLTKNIMPT